MKLKYFLWLAAILILLQIAVNLVAAQSMRDIPAFERQKMYDNEKTVWIGSPVISLGQNSIMYDRAIEIGLRPDGVVVWRYLEGAK